MSARAHEAAFILGAIDWKNPHDVRRWQENFLERFQRGKDGKRKKPVMSAHDALSEYLENPIFTGVPRNYNTESAKKLIAEFAKGRELSEWCDSDLPLGEVLKRQEGRGAGQVKKLTPSQMKHMVPRFLGRDAAGWMIAPILKRQDSLKLEKAKEMFTLGLEAKAHRQAICEVMGGEVHCSNGHSWLDSYKCACRYCPHCGPIEVNKLFARHVERLRFVAQRLMLCGADECRECNQAIENKRLPHWPPPRGATPHVVCAKLDFTVRKSGEAMPESSRMVAFNECIKRFCRAIETQFRTVGTQTIQKPEPLMRSALVGLTPEQKKARRKEHSRIVARWRGARLITRDRYGLAYCDEFGGNNNNPHAHGIYVGPWLPNDKKELSRLWEKITKKEFPGTFIISIKYTNKRHVALDFGEALYHAVKYPAKFAERSGPQRLALLEKVFHDVRRFHTLGSFYNPEAPENPEPEPRVCPICKSPLTDWYRWEGVLEMRARGLHDVREGQRIAGDGHANHAPHAPP